VPLNIFCALAAIAILVVFSAVNLFIPYALIVLVLAIGMVAFFGISCGLLNRDQKSECWLGYC
jgi:hypothetical protein